MKAVAEEMSRNRMRARFHRRGTDSEASVHMRPVFCRLRVLRDNDERLRRVSLATITAAKFAFRDLSDAARTAGINTPTDIFLSKTILTGSIRFSVIRQQLDIGRKSYPTPVFRRQVTTL